MHLPVLVAVTISAVSAGMYGNRDRFGCKVCSFGTKTCQSICSQCKVGWEDEAFACRKCELGEKYQQYNCRRCRRNENVAIEDTRDIQKELLYKDIQYEYYKVTVDKGTRMTEGKVPETCEKAHMKAVCPGSRQCKHTNEAKCVVTPLNMNWKGWTELGGRFSFYCYNL